jgi:hypothetical protein
VKNGETARAGGSPTTSSVPSLASRPAWKRPELISSTPLQHALVDFQSALAHARADERTHRTFLNIVTIRIGSEYVRLLAQEEQAA